MTVYRTCRGCIHEHDGCSIRGELRKRLEGLGITSVKFRCHGRVDRFQPGDAVWARTAASTVPDDYGHMCHGDFPGTVISKSSKGFLVYIQTGSAGKGCSETFQANNDGFCNLPLSRLEPREAERQTICKDCDRPEISGHKDDCPQRRKETAA